jgi:hypothetical protein
MYYRLLGAIFVASICRLMLAGVAPRPRTLAPISRPNWPEILPGRTCVRAGREWSASAMRHDPAVSDGR